MAKGTDRSRVKDLARHHCRYGRLLYHIGPLRVTGTKEYDVFYIGRQLSLPWYGIQFTRDFGDQRIVAVSFTAVAFTAVAFTALSPIAHTIGTE